MAGLISDQLLDNLRAVAYRQCVTPITIQRNTPTTTDADTKKVWTTTSTTTAWLVGKNIPAPELGTGRNVVIESNYELRLRQGVDIRAGDRVLIDDGIYAVIDENSEVTISLYLKCSLRRVT